jgi:hypothetical protein
MYAAKTTRDNISVAGMGLIARETNVQVPLGKTATMLAADLSTMNAASIR